MDAQTGHCVDLYEDIKCTERRLNRLNNELNSCVSHLSDEQTANYLEGCKHVDEVDSQKTNQNQQSN